MQSWKLCFAQCKMDCITKDIITVQHHLYLLTPNTINKRGKLEKYHHSP